MPGVVVGVFISLSLACNRDAAVKHVPFKCQTKNFSRQHFNFFYAPVTIVRGH